MKPDLDAFWMPFTANRQFKKAPRLLTRSSGMHYWDDQGRQILDGVAGLWCVNAGHARPKIVKAIQAQAAELDFAPPFQMAHPKAFELADRVAKIAPPGMNKVFFTNSGSESVETALKMAIAYHRARGEGTRTRLIGRERGYHGVNFGGISVGGMVGNRKMFGTCWRRGPHPPHARPGAQRLQRRPAGARRRAGGRPGAPGRAARRVDHRRGDRRAVAGSTGVLVPPRGTCSGCAKSATSTASC
jgi:beta-alanine--pyruvate transaminase